MPHATIPIIREPSLKMTDKNAYSHEPVMKDEVLRWIITDKDGLYLDSTVGLGGHAFGILKSLSEKGRLLGLDMDPEALEYSKKRLAPFNGRFELIHSNFKDMNFVLQSRSFFPLSGVLFDLGVSSLELDNPRKGFSFNSEGPLDMRFSPDNPLTAAHIVNRWPEDQITRVLFEYGEEKSAGKIARAIVHRREKAPFQTTTDLAALIAQVNPREKIHPATLSFMALRIAVNGELDNINPGLEGAVSSLKKGGRIVVITFHSLEDRMVKRLFESFAERGLCQFLNKKRFDPSDEEIKINPRARSARLRVMEKINEK